MLTYPVCVPDISTIISAPEPRRVELPNQREDRWVRPKDTTEDEAKTRLIQGLLNKLTPENFEKLLEKLANPSLYVTADDHIILVKLIFQKVSSSSNY